MPHAALFVVQEHPRNDNIRHIPCFNAARGFVCGASTFFRNHHLEFDCFNAARGFVCGASGKESGKLEVQMVSMPHAALFVVQAPWD